MPDAKKKKIRCDLHKTPETMPDVAPIGKRVMSFLSFSEEQKLVTKYLIDSNGKFRLRHPIVVEALWTLIKEEVLAKLETYDEKCGDAADEDCTSCDA